MTREERVPVPGTELYCRQDGAAGEAPWIVFSNSLVTNLSIWDAQVEALGDRFRVLRYDQRGHGATPPGPQAPDMPLLGADLLAAMDAFGVDRCTFVGLSMGVPTGLAAFGVAPERFERLVFSDGQAKTAPTGAATWAERIEFARANGMKGYADDTVKRWLSAQHAAGPKGEALHRMVAATPLEGFVHGATALQGYDHVAEVARIDCPLLVVAGAKDGPMPTSMKATFGDVPGVRIEIVPDAGHVPNFEAPEAFNAVFLDALGLSR